MALPAFELQRIKSSASPILLLDTCTLLDVIRDVTRATNEERNAIAGLQLLNHAEANRLHVLIAEQVKNEYGDNYLPTKEAAEAALKKFRDQSERIDRLSAAYGSAPPPVSKHLDGHVGRTDAVLQRWMTVARVVTPSAAVSGRAFHRIQNAIAPSTKGKESAKDCVVFETYLELMSELRADSVTVRATFASSNVNDYRPGGAVAPALTNDLVAVKLDYASSFHEAKHHLGL